MKPSSLLIGLMTAVVLICPAISRGETAQQAFERGDQLVAQSDFREALQAHAAAVRADRSNQEYIQRFMLVRQIILLRANLDQERDFQRWYRTAKSLRSFYVSEGIYSEALLVDKRLHAKMNSASSAAQLAETQLAMGKNADAAQVLEALGPSKGTANTQALLCIALAKQGQTSEAREIAAGIAPSDSADTGTLYSLARMHAVVGNHDQALSTLTRCFEGVPPSRLDDFRSHASESPEFAALASTDGFAEALETKSKVVESQCSAGSSCSGCPMRGQCPSSGDGR